MIVTKVLHIIHCVATIVLLLIVLSINDQLILYTAQNNLTIDSMKNLTAKLAIQDMEER